MTRPPLLAAYGLLTGLAEPWAPAMLRSRALRGKEQPDRLGERLGRPGLPRPEGPLIWLHGASVGEGLSTLPLAQGLVERRPGLNVLITTSTVTSAELLGRRLPEISAARIFHQYAPVDAPGAMRRFLDHWRPDLAVLVESELWPNLIAQTQARGVPLALLSARLSVDSLGRWRRAPRSGAALISAFDLVMAQDDETASGLQTLGARDDGRLNLKLAGAPLPADPAQLDAHRRLKRGRAMLLAASTHAGEEAGILASYAAISDHPATPHLVIVPRHPMRGVEVALQAKAAGWSATRQGAGQPFSGAERVHVADLLGELGMWFRLASGCFVGGSWAAGVGGHNPLEPARLDCPLAAGTRVGNWTAVYAGLQAVGGVSFVDGPEALTGFWRRAMEQPSDLMTQAAAARCFAETHTGALGTALDRLEALL